MQIKPVIYLAALMSSSACLAQNEVPVPQAPSSFEDVWKFNVGMGVGSQMKFPGSDTRRTRVMPMFSAGYGRFYIGGAPGAGSPAGVGMFLLRESGWSVGVGLGGNLTSPRKESDSPRLKGMGDISKSASGSFFANYDWHWLAVHSSVQTDIGGKHLGTTASLGLEARMPLGSGFMLSAGPGLTWADRKYAQTFFGVSAAQSAASGLPTYEASSGLNSLRLNLGLNYRIDPRWTVGLRGSFGRLRGSAVDSPITESTHQDTFGLMASYGF